MSRTKVVKVLVSEEEHEQWTAYAEKTFGGNKLSLAVRMAMNREVLRDAGVTSKKVR